MRVAVLTLLCVLAAFGQTQTAELGGRITDQTGAVVPGVQVTLTSDDTGDRRSARSNELGLYSFPLLKPGRYSLALERSGFRSVERAGITLHINDLARLDVVMEVGDVAQKMTVLAEAPLLQTADASLGQVIDNSKVVGLPLSGRSAFRLAALTPGYNPTPGAYGQFGDVAVNTTWDANFSINGGQGYSNEIHIDGAPSTAGYFNQITTIPSVDAVEEFKVQANTVSAEFGRFGGGVLNVSTKSGTNRLRGSVFEFLRNSALDANDFFNNRAGRDRPAFRMNQFGGAVGGPIRHDRTFFFLNYEGTRWRRGDVFTTTLPTAIQREGDFSRTFNGSGQLIVIYDPLSTRADPARPGQYLRTAFPANRITPDRMNPISRNILKFYGLPNTAGNPPSGANNFVSNAGRTVDKDQGTIRIDQNFSERQRVFLRYSPDDTRLCQPNYFGNVASPSAVGCTSFLNKSGTLEDSYTLTPTTILTVRYGFARWYQIRAGRSYGFDQRELGFPAAFVALQQVPVFPVIGVTGYSVLGSRNRDFLDNGNDTHSLLVSLVKVTGRHSLKFGADIRVGRINLMNPGQPGGGYNFNQSFTQGPDPVRSSVTAGDAMASLLLGFPNSGSIDSDPGSSLQNWYYAGYIQDDVKVSPKLTLNVGLRYETESPYTERRNRLVGFDPDLASPVAPGLKGGLHFAGGDSRHVYDWFKRGLAPRLGLAYQLQPKTVLRAAGGVFYAPLQISNNAVGFVPSWGYAAATSMVTSVDGGLTPFHTLSNPFPNGLVPPTGSSLGAATFVGQALPVWDSHPHLPYSLQWNAGLQRQLAGSVVVDLSYAGNHGVRLARGREMNSLPTSQLALGSALLGQVDNPFAGKIGTGVMSQAKVIRSRLLRPFPQFEGISIINSTSGNSIYHSFQMKVEKRFGSGLAFLAAYTAAKTIGDVPFATAGIGPDIGAGSFQDWYNLRSERSIAAQDVSQYMVFNYTYELPFGAGKRFGAGLGGVTGKLVSGWQVNGITTMKTGNPMTVGTAANSTNSLGGGSRPNSTGNSARLSGGRSTGDKIARWFDTTAFTLPEPYTFGNVSRTLPDVRKPGVSSSDFSIFKNTRLKERLNLQFRAEFFNLFNAVLLGPPDGSLGSRSFGTINATALLPRVVQIALKLIF